MRNAILKSLHTACVITTITGLSTLAAAAADSTTTTGTAGYGTTTQSATADHSAKGFIKQAFHDNQMEIDLAGIGMNKAENANLKSFCQELQTDHTQANQQLQPIAQKYGVTEQQSVLREHRVNKFEKESAGPQFDKKLATELLKSHEQTISKFERASTKLQEPDVKQYVDNMLPKLRQHFQKAATVAREVGVEQSTISSLENKVPAVGGTSETTESQNATGTGGQVKQGTGAQELQPDAHPKQP